MSESMVERAARAMHTRKYGEWYEGPCTMTDSQRECLADARAAIKAMREPTDAMMYDGGGKTAFNMSIAAATYRVMIDAALNEQVAG